MELIQALYYPHIELMLKVSTFRANACDLYIHIRQKSKEVIDAVLAGVAAYRMFALKISLMAGES